MFRSECDERLQAALDDELTAQVNRAFDETIEYARKVSQQVFLVNAGGAAASLAYMGSTSGSDFVIWPLLCFLIGVICGVIELRSLARFFFVLHQDAMERRTKWMEDEIDAKQTLPAAEIAQSHRSFGKVSSWIALAAFPVGVISGLISLVCG